MMTPLARNPKTSSLPVNQGIEPHKERYTKYEICVHSDNPEIQKKLYCMRLSIDMYELCARDRIPVRHLEGLAVMQLVPAQMQFVGDMFGDEIRTGTTVD